MAQEDGSQQNRKGRFRLLATLAAIFTIAVLQIGVHPSPVAALDSQEEAVITLINDYRAANGLDPLSTSSTLNEVARWMSQDMAANNYFSHTDSLGRDPFKRMCDFGYCYNTWKGENLAAGIETAQAAFDLWKGSPPHNANLLNASFVVIGVARAYDPDSDFGWYWATELGGQAEAPSTPTPTPPPPPPPEPTPTPSPPPAEATPEPPTPTPEPPSPTPTPPPPTPTPTPIPTPTPTPIPLPSPTPTPVVPPPSWELITASLLPVWDRLVVVGPEGSFLVTVAFLTEKYLAATSGLVAGQGDSPPGQRDSQVAWLAAPSTALRAGRRIRQAAGRASMA